MKSPIEVIDMLSHNIYMEHKNANKNNCFTRNNISNSLLPMCPWLYYTIFLTYVHLTRTRVYTYLHIPTRIVTYICIAMCLVIYVSIYLYYITTNLFMFTRIFVYFSPYMNIKPCFYPVLSYLHIVYLYSTM